MENPIEMDDLGVPLFLETTICDQLEVNLHNKYTVWFMIIIIPPLMAKVWAEQRMVSFSCLVLGAQAIATPTLIQANGTWQQTKVENMSASSLYEELKISGTNEFIQVC